MVDYQNIVLLYVLYIITMKFLIIIAVLLLIYITTHRVAINRNRNRMLLGYSPIDGVL